MPGVVSRLWRYPVKSMPGEPRRQLCLEKRGVEGDRLFAVRDAGGKLGSGKSTRSLRRIDGLMGFRAAYRGETPEIVFPDGRRLSGDDPGIHETLSATLAIPVTLTRESDVSHLDAAPVHLVTTAALAWLKAALPTAKLDPRRFRPNLVVDVAGETPLEHAWVGCTLRVGRDVRIRIVEPTERCRMVTLAQDDLPEDPSILRQIGRDSDLHFGVYADIIVPGEISLGDPVSLADS